MALVRKLIFELCVFKYYRKKITQVFVESDLYFDYRLITIISLLTDWQKCGEWFWEAKFFQGVKGRGEGKFCNKRKECNEGLDFSRKKFLLVCLFICLYVCISVLVTTSTTVATHEKRGKMGVGDFCTSGFRLGCVCGGKTEGGGGEIAKNFGPTFGYVSEDRAPKFCKIIRTEN